MKLPSKKYHRISDAYKFFAMSFDADFSEESRIRFYNYETHGTPVVKYNVPYSGKYNGYAIGKHWMDVNLAMYREDLKSGNLTKHELYSDDDIPPLIKEIISNIFIPL